MEYDEFLSRLKEVPRKWHLTVNQQIRSGRTLSYSPITAVCKMVTGIDYRKDLTYENGSLRSIEALKLSHETAKKIIDAGNNFTWNNEILAIRKDLLIATRLI